MQNKIIILDFGSHYTQLIARRVRELNVYCEILPYYRIPEPDDTTKGIILSGSPYSVTDEKAPAPDLTKVLGKVPLLGVCYGAQYIAIHSGGVVESSETREYGRANLETLDNTNPLFKNIDKGCQVWMSHGDTITSLPKGLIIM
jgi:GMP synthase (glutamine-hydrolysing)